MGMKELLRPESVALVGASDKPTFGGFAAQNLLRSKKDLRFYFVNPNRDEIYGKKCYKSLDELPETVDCAVLAIPKQNVASTLEFAGRKGIRAAIVYASGFSEEHSAEGERLDQELRDIAQRYEMSVMGPNCLGIVNNVDKINLMGLDMGIDLDRNPKVAVIAHSGALSTVLVQRGRYPVAYQVSVGNGTVTAMEDYIDYFLDEDDVKVIALYMEGILKPQVFLNALKKSAVTRKPIVMLKTGRGKLAVKAVASHTGSMAGSYEAFLAVCKKYGVITVDNLEELINVSYMLGVLNGNYPKVPTVAGMNLSGGANTLMAESGEAIGIDFPAFDEPVKEKLRQFIPVFSTPANPLDATTDLFYKPQNIREILKVFDETDEIGVVVTGHDIGPEISPLSVAFAQGLVEAKSKYGVKKPILCGGLDEKTRNAEVRVLLEEAGIPLMASMEPTMKSARYLLDFISYDPADHDLRLPELSGEAENTVALTEWESKTEMSEAGLPVNLGFVARSREDFEKLAELREPLAAKISSPDILHKSDVGGVRLNVLHSGKEQVFDEILENCAAACPGARLEGVLFEEMAEKGGTEFIIGVVTDPQLGPIVLVGMGGVFVEIFKDSQLCPAPLSRKEAMDMLRKLKSFRLLQGYRGDRKKDIDALADTIVKVSEYAFTRSKTLKELDLNPVFVYEEGKGVRIIDALIINKG